MYGLLSHAVAIRTRELGIRMTLGATGGMVAMFVAARAALLATAGVLGGSALAAWSLGILAGFVFGISPRDPATIVAAAVTAWLSAIAAALLPARRAARLAPLAAIRPDE
jgi:ABC-type antimicrobial peptide transport system permease subunit